MSEKKINVLIVDDHPVVLEGIRACLVKKDCIGGVAEATSGAEAIEKAQSEAPDVVLMDISMPDMSGLTAIRRILAADPETKVLCLTMHDNREYVTEAIRAGASGYVLKDTSPADLIRAIETVNCGEKFFGIGVRPVDESESRSQRPALSQREVQVLEKIADGFSNKEIGLRLNVSVRTVETHRERIMQKLDIHSVAGLTKYAISKGLVAVK